MNVLVGCDGPVPHDRMNYRGEPLVAFLAEHDDVVVHVVCPRPEVPSAGIPGRVRYWFTAPYAPVRNFRSGISRATDIARLAKTMRRVLAAQRIDCIRTISSIPTVAARLARGRRPIPIVANLSDFYVDLYDSSGLPGLELARPIILAFNGYAARANAVIVDSREQRDAWVMVGAPRAATYVLPHGLPRSLRLSRSQPASIALRDLVPVPVGIPTIFYVGDVSGLDGLDVLLEASAALRDERRPMACVIVGAGSIAHEASLNRLVTQLRLNNLVFRVRSVPNSQLAGLMADADVLVAPFRLTATTSTAIPNKVLEYLTTSRPIVATRTTALEETVGAAIEYVEAGDVGSLRRALDRCVSAPESAGGDRAARARIQESLGWRSIIRAEVEIIRGAVRGSLPSPSTIR